MGKLQVELRMTINNYWVVVGLKNKKLEKVYVPDRVDGYEVRSIAGGAFANNKNITYINLPESINYIGEGAFSGCSNLEKVYRNYSHYGKLEIHNRAFFNCAKLSNIHLNGITELGKEVFDGCTALTEFPFDACENLKVLKQRTFANTGITSVTLHSQQVCKNAFYNTPVEEVFIRGKATWSTDFYDVLKKAQVYVPKKSPFLDLSFHGICVKESLK